MKRQPRFEVYPETHHPLSRFRWRLLAGNNRIIADGGEPYSTRSKARQGAIRVVNLGETARFVDLGTDGKALK